jgi:predicted secreted protein
MKISRIIFLAAAVIVSKGYAEAENVIHLKKGQTYRIELDSTPSFTGLRWHEDDLPKDGPIKIIEAGFIRDEKKKAIMCSPLGKQYWVIKARRKPTSTDLAHLIIHDKRLSNDTTGINTYTFKITQ